MRTFTILSSAVLLASIARAQDSRQVTEFKDAVEKQNGSQVDTLAKAIASANTKKAVDILVGGYDILAQVLNRLWQEKLAWQGEIDRYDDWMDEVKRFNKEVEERQRKGTPADPALVKKRDDLLAKIKKFDENREKVVAIENKMIEINRIKRSITDALATITDDGAMKEMIHEIGRNGNWSARAAVAEAMGRIEHADVVPTLIERCAKEQDAMVLCAILEAFKTKNQWTSEIINAVASLLDSKWWQVKLAAAQALGSSKSTDAVDPLIRAMGTAEGRVKWEIHDALVAITGVDKGMGADAWKTWFDSNRDEVKGGTYKPKDGEGAGPNAVKGTVTFYGIPVKSKSFVIIMDRSGSMAEPGGYDEEEEKTIETGGAQVKNSNPQGLKPDPRMRKIDVAKYQVKKVLYAIENKVKFNVIFFNHLYTVYKPDGMVMMDEGARKSAIAWVEALEPEGNTDPWQAIQKAMEFCAEPGFDGKPRKDGADTIYIMTDGTPFPPGKVVGTNEICDKVKEWNRLRKIVFNTVYVSASTDKDYANGTAFMKRLAEENGGICKIPKAGGGAQPGGNPPPPDPNKKP
jgi:hypothetical protein